MSESEWVVFCDESGIVKGPPCYTIGALAIRKSRLADFERWFDRHKAEHGVIGEVKWHKVSTSYGLSNFALEFFFEAMNEALRADCRLHFIVVHKRSYRLWQARDKEAAFYKTYTLLLEKLAEHTSGNHSVIMDAKSDAYSLRHEIIETVGNHMLRQRDGAGLLGSVERGESGDYPGLQAIDLLTGAINSSRWLNLAPDSATVNRGKRLTIKCLAAIIGWDALHYDTFPVAGRGKRNEVFNIWHFPPERRGVPPSRLPKAPQPPNWIRREDFSKTPTKSEAGG